MGLQCAPVRDWARPGVNLRANDYYLDLREMPGSKRCRVEVIATNGYRTSYAATRHFGVPTKPPELLLEDNEGPVLFAQGFSRDHGTQVEPGRQVLCASVSRSPVRRPRAARPCSVPGQ